MSHDKIMQIGKRVSMIGTKRFVNIRGYVREVTVMREAVDPHIGGRAFVVMDGKRTEFVPIHLFYHKHNDQLIARDVEFERNYNNHPVEIENLPSL